MLADLSTRAKLRMTGADRERYLNGQVTNDVRELRPGGASLYACVTTAKGKLEGDVFITALKDAYLLDADPSLRETLLARLQKYIIADDVTIEDVTDEYSLFHLAGDPSEHFDIPGAVFRASSRYGIEGSDLWTSRESAPPAPADKFASTEALEQMRISHGVPKWGAELTPDILPPEAGLQERAISYTKGCYIGQEVISRIQSAGKVNKRLVGLIAVDPAATLEPGLTLYTEIPEKPLAIGTLTSCSSQPAIALAYVKPPYASPGTPLFAGDEGAPLSVAVEISKTPLILQ